MFEVLLNLRFNALLHHESDQLVGHFSKNVLCKELPLNLAIKYEVI